MMERNRELGIAPEDETRALYEEILAQRAGSEDWRAVKKKADSGREAQQ